MPYPNVEINLWKPDADPTRTFMKVNSLRVGPDGDLWVVDAGARGVGMASIRIRAVYDDPSDHPEADLLADSHSQLRKIFERALG